MIKKINAIATPYTATASKTNGTSTLDAAEWNNISSAVATAHSKINEVADLVGEQLDGTPTITSDNTSGSEKDLLVVGARDLKLEGDRNVDIAAVNSIGIRTDSTTGNDILIQPHRYLNLHTGQGLIELGTGATHTRGVSIQTPNDYGITLSAGDTILLECPRYNIDFSTNELTLHEDCTITYAENEGEENEDFHVINVTDLFKVIEYFKTNNSTGPFAV